MASSEPFSVPSRFSASLRKAGVLGEIPGFLKRPRLLTPLGLRTREAWKALAMLEALHVGVLLVVILPLIALWQRDLHLPAPDAFGKMPKGLLLPFAVLGAPVLEEVVFRGWQRGRPRALWLLACGALFAVLAVFAKAMAPLVVAGLLALLALAAVGGWIALRKRPEPPALFRKAYPVVFWVVALVFAAMHLTNYPIMSLAMLPMVLPQLWAGLLLGFTRQRLGLPASMLQHAGANAATMLLVHLGG